jgi:hypothetical protein
MTIFLIITIYAKRAWEFALRYKHLLLVGVALLAIVAVVWRSSRKPVDVQIVVPRQEIENLHRERRAEIERDLQRLEQERREMDKRLRALQEKARRRGNINARELEELLK